MHKIVLIAGLLLGTSFLNGCEAQPATPANATVVQMLMDATSVDAGGDLDLNFTLPEIAPGRQVRLSTDARVGWPDFGGATYYMGVEVNGLKLQGHNLLNKAPDLMFRNGMDMAWFQMGAWNLVYSSDFSDRISTALTEYSVVSPDPYHFVWDITPYVKAGQNTIRFHQNKLLDQPTPLVLRDVKVEQGAPMAAPEGVAVHPPPQGPLPVYVAKIPATVKMQAELAADGRIRLKADGRTFEVTSRTSLPNGAWTKPSTSAKWQDIGSNSKPVTWTGKDYTVSRRVEKQGDHLRVFDTISNTGKELAGVMIENRLALPTQAKEIVLAGRPRIGETSFREQAGHPTALALWPDYAVGLVAEDDIFRIHHRAFTEPGVIGLSDPRLGIAPGKSHTLEWSIYPQAGGDYWSFINAIRRNWNSNFKLLSAAFDNNGSTTRRPPEEQKAWVSDRKLDIAISTQSDFSREEVKTIPSLAADAVLSTVPPQYPVLAEGTAIPMAKNWNDTAMRWAELNRSTNPPVRSVIYIDPNIVSEPGAAEKYADSKVMDATGKHLVTPFFYPLYLYLPTLKNSYGKALMETVKYMVDDMKADGLYMDEFSTGSVPAYIHHTQWDGCSVEIDPGTHAVKGQMTSSVLIQQPWRDAMIKYLRSKGKILLANTYPATRTANQWQVQFTGETFSYSNVIESHLGSPWALMNHSPQQDDVTQAQMARRVLDYGGMPCAYYWWDKPQQPHFLSLMYPTTPQELHAGMVLGKERIVTNRSGRYGWPDGNAAEVYVFDGVGKPVAKSDVKTVTQGKKNFIDVRMPSDHIAILVKKAPM